MLQTGHGSLTRWLAALLCVGILSWLALEYLVPSPPSRITIATGPKGSSFDYFGRRYRARFARVGINLELRQTVGALENLKLLQDPKSGVDIGFTTGGVSDGSQAPELLSTGLIYNVPFWIFHPSSTSLDGLPQLKGKRIAVGPEGSGTRFTAERILSKANINAQTATLVPLEGNAAIEALDDGKVDAVLIVGGSDAPAVR
ncbi:MAG TPA: TAXI family TRAP transporter solute-binding subunit, partial [Xanthobacteraceae bacterium]